MTGKQKLALAAILVASALLVGGYITKDTWGVAFGQAITLGGQPQ